MIWKKYFFRELAKMLALFLGCLYFLYAIIDSATHTKIFQHEEISIWNIVLYYVWQFTKRADVLVPIALMISTVKVLTTANARNEILALVTGGISLKKILSPFLWCALCCCAFLYTNFQLLLPIAESNIVSFEERFFRDRGKSRSNQKVQALVLKDNSVLVYQAYDPHEKAFLDVFWLNDCDHLYKIADLFPYKEIPLGKYVDSLMRTSEGAIVKKASFEQLDFPNMQFDATTLFSAVNPPRIQSFSQLMRGMGTVFSLKKMSDREAQAATCLYFKMTIPLLCFFAVIGPSAFCLRFSRTLPLFFIYALSLFGIIAFYTLTNAFMILGESQVIPPLLAIVFPYLVVSLFFGVKYAKL